MVDAERRAGCGRREAHEPGRVELDPGEQLGGSRPGGRPKRGRDRGRAGGIDDEGLEPQREEPGAALLGGTAVACDHVVEPFGLSRLERRAEQSHLDVVRNHREDASIGLEPALAPVEQREQRPSRSGRVGFDLRPRPLAERHRRHAGGPGQRLLRREHDDVEPELVNRHGVGAEGCDRVHHGQRARIPSERRQLGQRVEDSGGGLSVDEGDDVDGAEAFELVRDLAGRDRAVERDHDIRDVRAALPEPVAEVGPVLAGHDVERAQAVSAEAARRRLERQHRLALENEDVLARSGERGEPVLDRRVLGGGDGNDLLDGGLRGDGHAISFARVQHDCSLLRDRRGVLEGVARAVAENPDVAVLGMAEQAYPAAERRRLLRRGRVEDDGLAHLGADQRRVGEDREPQREVGAGAGRVVRHRPADRRIEIERRPGRVEADLQPVAEQVAAAARAPEPLSPGGRRGAGPVRADAEIRDVLLDHGAAHELGKKSGSPGTAGPDHEVGLDVPPADEHGRSVGLCPAAKQVGAGGSGLVDECAYRVGSPEQARLRLVEHVVEVVCSQSGKEPGGRRGREQLGLDAFPGETAPARRLPGRVIRGGEPRHSDLAEQRTTGVALELQPEPPREPRAARLADVRSVGEAQDPRRCVRGRPPVARLMLLDERHLDSSTGECPGKGGSEHARTDDRHLHRAPST